MPVSTGYLGNFTGEEIDEAIARVRSNRVGVNRNLLDNWYFAGGGSQQGGGQLPINQRRKTNYTTAGNAIDRWRLTNPNGTFTLTENGCTLAGTSGNIWIQEYLENPGRFYGKKVTISLLTDEQLIATTGELTTEGVSQNTGFSLGGSNGLSLGFYKTSDGSAFLQIGVSSGNSNTLIAAKIELGDHQTLAYQDEDGNWQLFETPDYAEELAKCQRYYEQTYWSVFYAVANSASQIDYAGSLVFSVQKRIAPTSTVNPNPLQNLSVQDASNGFTPVSGCALQIPTAYNRNMIAPRVTGNFTIGHIYRIAIPDNAYIISAEL